MAGRDLRLNLHSKAGWRLWTIVTALSAATLWFVWMFIGVATESSSGNAAAVAAGTIFVLAAVGYIMLHGLKGLAWFSVPIVLTVRALVEFVIIPGWQLTTTRGLMDPQYSHALFLVALGFIAFWIASLLCLRRTELRYASSTHTSSERMGWISFVLFVIGVATSFFLWKSGLFEYTADSSLREASSSSLQWIFILSDLLIAALLVSSIEKFGKPNPTRMISFVFWASFASSVGFGAISGMKSELLKPILLVLLVYGLMKSRIPRISILVPFLLIAMYPFVNAYRDNLNSGYRNQSYTVGGLVSIVWDSITDVISSGSAGDTAQSGVDDSTERLSALAFVHDIIGLSDPSLIEGDEKLWLAPVYPFIPRVLWPGKPVFDKGSRLSVALGRPRTTSSASTPVGDLYSLYGTYGVLIGMFVYGACLQLYMNWISSSPLSERGIFFYVALLMPLIDIEVDSIVLVSGAIHAAMVVFVMSYLIYGQSIWSNPEIDPSAELATA